MMVTVKYKKKQKKVEEYEVAWSVADCVPLRSIGLLQEFIFINEVFAVHGLWWALSCKRAQWTSGVEGGGRGGDGVASKIEESILVSFDFEEKNGLSLQKWLN